MRTHLLLQGNQGGGYVTAAQVFGERGSNLPRDEVVSYLLDQNGSPCVAPAMHSSIGIERMKLVREA